MITAFVPFILPTDVVNHQYFERQVEKTLLQKETPAFFYNRLSSTIFHALCFFSIHGLHRG